MLGFSLIFTLKRSVLSDELWAWVNATLKRHGPNEVDICAWPINYSEESWAPIICVPRPKPYLLEALDELKGVLYLGLVLTLRSPGPNEEDMWPLAQSFPLIGLVLMMKNWVWSYP